MKRTLLASVLLLPIASATALCVAPATAQAADGDAVLKKLDALAESFEDQTYTAEMHLYRGGKKTKTLVFSAKMKGLERQYIEFENGDVKGMKVLMTDSSTIYMYSPEFKKVRKVAAHNQKQGMMGSDFGPKDMQDAKLSNSYTAEIKGKSGNETTLTLTPKDSDSPWASVEIVIDKTKGGVTKLRYFDGSGKLIRVQTRESWKKVNGVRMPTKITMENKKNGNKTVIELNDIEVNTGIKDSVFSRKTLLRG